MIDAIINVDGAVLSRVAFGAGAGVVACVVHAIGTVRTRIELWSAERYLLLAEFT